FGNVIESDVSAQAINIETIDIELDAVPEPESEPAATLEVTVAEWSTPEEYWDTISRFDELPTNDNER
ncbi:MAG: hypothetical protein ACRDTT_35365, partial [Pseudonocardiaceae bacterium]